MAEREREKANKEAKRAEAKAGVVNLRIIGNWEERKKYVGCWVGKGRNRATTNK